MNGKHLIKGTRRGSALTLALVLLLSLFPMRVFALPPSDELTQLTVSREEVATNKQIDFKQDLAPGVIATRITLNYKSNTAIKNTIPAGSSIYEVLDDTTAYQIAKIDLSNLTSCPQGATATVYINGAEHETKAIADLCDRNGYAFPDGTTSYQILFHDEGKISSAQGENIIHTYFIPLQPNPTTPATSTLRVYANAAPVPVTQSATASVSRNLLILSQFGLDTNAATADRFPSLSHSGYGMGLTQNNTLFDYTPTGDITYRYFYMLGSSVGDESGHLSTTENTVLTSHVHSAMKLKTLTLPADFARGKSGVPAAESTFELYLDGVLYTDPASNSTQLSTTQTYTLLFDGTKHINFELRYADGTMFFYAGRRNHPAATGSVTATYVFVPAESDMNFNNYYEVKTDINGQTYSNLDPTSSPLLQHNGLSGYGFFRKLGLRSTPEHPVYAPDEDIVFELSDMTLAKYVGDFSLVYFSVNASRDLENYYIKDVEFIHRPESSLSPYLPLSANISGSEPTDKVDASFPTTSESLGSYHLTNAANNMNIDQFHARIILAPTLTPITSAMQAMTPYEMADIVGGANLRHYSIRITYAPKPGNLVTASTVLNSKVDLTIAPTNSETDPLRVTATVTGQAKIVIPAQICTLTYDANGGGGTMPDNSIRYERDDMVTVLDNTFSLANHTFIGWDTKADGSGTTYSPDATFQIQADTTLYAQWSRDPSYILYFVTNGGTPVDPLVLHAIATVPINQVTTRDNHQFVGWYSDAALTTAVRDLLLDANKTVYAKWEILENPGGGGGNEPSVPPVVPPTVEPLPPVVPPTVEPLPPTQPPVQGPYPETPGFQQPPEQEGNIVKKDDVFFFVDNEGVPLAYFDEELDEWIMIEDEFVPMAGGDIPMTSDSDHRLFSLATMLVSALGLVLLTRGKRTNKDA